MRRALALALLAFVGYAAAPQAPPSAVAETGGATAATRDVPETAGRDTTFTVPAGSRVRIRSSDGDIRVRAVRGRQARVELEHGEDRIEVRRRGGAFEIGPKYGEGGDLDVTLPADVPLEVMGADGDITVVGFSESVVVETFDGDVSVEGGAAVTIHSVDGDVHVEGVRGPITMDLGDGDAIIRDVAGPVVVNGIDGDLIVRGADARSVVLSTISGTLHYDGRVYDGGEYRLATHDGDVFFALPEGVGARVSVLTYDGALIPSFPVELRGSIGSIAEFTLGNGGARIQLESFDGNIHLIRPGERPDNHGHGAREER